MDKEIQDCLNENYKGTDFSGLFNKFKYNSITHLMLNRHTNKEGCSLKH